MNEQKLEVWVGKIEVRQLPRSDHKIELSGKGAFTWVTCWARDPDGYRAKVIEVMNDYGLFVVEVDQVIPFAKAEDLEIVDDELIEQFSDTAKDEQFCIYGTFYNYMTDN